MVGGSKQSITDCDADWEVCLNISSMDFSLVLSIKYDAVNKRWIVLCW